MSKGDPKSAQSSRVTCAVFLALMVLLVVLLVCLLELPRMSTPQVVSNLSCRNPAAGGMPFPTGIQNVVLGNNNVYLLDKSVTVNTITIQDGATLIIVDGVGSIQLKTKYILIIDGGSFLVGSETCPYVSDLDIELLGRSDDPEYFEPFGRKFIGVGPTGSIGIHGPWKLSWTFLQSTILPGSEDKIIDLADSASSWSVGNEIVIASSDYNMSQTERFVLLDCPTCSNYQVKIKGPILYQHSGVKTSEGIDVRAEVGLLTRNIKIHGHMESSCYLDNKCDYFNYDTFGGQTEVLAGAVTARFEGIELYNMGQQVLGSYPIHFHRLFLAYGKYARQLSVHDSFSRCVTLHASEGILVEDVVGFNCLGHCFFLEDGNEINNTLRHNLGLVTRAGSLLPSDRNDVMCRGLTANKSVYVPDPDKDCKGTSTFWISHPSNVLENNAAAGSEEVGYYYPFYRDPTGPSENTLPSFHGERSPLEKFANNRAHSNPEAFVLDSGVKTSQPSDSDPRDFLALIDLERYEPHVDRNLSLMRVPALLENFTAYKNGLALLVRGGDIYINSANLADNDIAVKMASSPSLPYDSGSHQQVTNSVIVGKSSDNKNWSSRTDPCVGIQVQEGPVLVAGNKFYNFVPSTDRKAYAIGFLPNNTGLSSPANMLGANDFDNKSVRISLERSVEGVEPDGDLTRILYDSVGSLTGVTGSYVIRADNDFLMTSSCQTRNDSLTLYAFCPGARYGLLFVNVTSQAVSMNIREVSSSDIKRNMTLTGIKSTDPTLPATTQFQPVIVPNTRYRLTWSGNPAPSQLDLSTYKLNMGESTLLEICFPPNTTFNVTQRVWNQVLDQVVNSSMLIMATSMQQYTADAAGQLFYWDSVNNLLNLKLVTQWQTTYFDYCPSDGCHFVSVSANITSNMEASCK